MNFYVDASCQHLIQTEKILPCMLALIEQELAFMEPKATLSERLRDVVRVLHAAIGALKNLSVSGNQIKWYI